MGDAVGLMSQSDVFYSERGPGTLFDMFPSGLMFHLAGLAFNSDWFPRPWRLQAAMTQVAASRELASFTL